MTREEQIKKQADIYIGHQQDLGEDISITNKRDAFIKGAKWADKTMIDKACEWLKLNTNWDDEWDEMGRNMNYGKIEEFRKVMEE